MKKHDEKIADETVRMMKAEIDPETATQARATMIADAIEKLASEVAGALIAQAIHRLARAIETLEIPSTGSTDRTGPPLVLDEPTTNAAAPVASPLKWHGGKSYLASKIVAMMPTHTHYVEPFAGGLSVLLAKESEGVSEVVNDSHRDLTNFWEVLRLWTKFVQFKRDAETIPFSESAYDRAVQRLAQPWAAATTPASLDDVIERAVAFFVACRQSLAGRMQGFATLSRTRTRRGMNEQASAWLTTVDGLEAVHERLRRVVILNRDALDVIRQQDGPATLFYLDPPYLHATRATVGEYAHEMDDEQHAELLAALGEIKGRFLLSGYRSELYDEAAAGCDWHRRDFDLPNNSAGGATKRRMIESVWTNYEPAASE